MTVTVSPCGDKSAVVRAMSFVPATHRMLRLLRSITPVRRLLAAIIVLAISASSLEAAVPDVHDGSDAAHVASDVNGTGAGLLATACNSVGPRSDAATGVKHRIASANCEPGSDHRHDSGSPLRGCHVEHCGHTHAAQGATALELDVPRLHRAVGPSARIVTLLSITSAQTLRPPIA